VTLAVYSLLHFSALGLTFITAFSVKKAGTKVEFKRFLQKNYHLLRAYQFSEERNFRRYLLKVKPTANRRPLLSLLSLSLSLSLISFLVYYQMFITSF
jgi:hypothetical protein